MLLLLEGKLLHLLQDKRFFILVGQGGDNSGLSSLLRLFSILLFDSRTMFLNHACKRESHKPKNKYGTASS